jgi:hypothetical protein
VVAAAASPGRGVEAVTAGTRALRVGGGGGSRGGAVLDQQAGHHDDDDGQGTGDDGGMDVDV